MSSAEFPPSISKRKSNAYDSRDAQGLVDMSGLIKTSNVYNNISGVLQRKSNVGGYVDTTRHTIENQENDKGIKSLSIVKRQRVPVSQAVAVVSAQKMVGTSIFHPAREESVSDIATFNKNQDISTVSGKAMARPSKRNRNYFGDEHIQDASYVEMTEEILREMESPKYKVYKPEFSKAPPKNAKDLGLAERSKVPEPVDFAVISATKQKTKQSLVKRPTRSTKPITATDSFDYIVNTLKIKLRAATPP
jgi:hypothetical protein